MSKPRFWALNLFFIVVSLLILFYPIPITVKAAGKTVPAMVYCLDAPFAGELTEVNAAEGSEVKSGSVILKLKSEKLSADIEQLLKESEIITAKIKSEQTELNIQQAKAQKSKLYYEVGSIPLSEKSEAQEKVTLLEKNYDVLIKEKGKITAQVAYLRRIQEKGSVTAPVDGIILSALHDRAGKMFAEGEELLKIASKAMVLDVLIPEDQATIVYPGAEAKIRFGFDPLKIYHGRVISIDSKVQEEVERVWIKKNVVRVTIELLDTEMPLVPGMQAHISVGSDKKQTLVQKLLVHLLF